MSKKIDMNSPDYRKQVADEAKRQMGLDDTSTSAKEDPKVPDKSSEKSTESIFKRSFKFKDDFGDETDFEIDEESLPSVAESAFKFKTLSAELKAMQDELKSLRVERDNSVTKAKKWLDLEKSGNKQLLIDEILKDEGGIEGIRTNAIEEFKKYSSLSDEERKDFDFKRSQAENTRKLEEMRKQLEAKVKEANEREAKARRQEYESTMRTVAHRYFIPNGDSDERINGLNEAMHNKAMSLISAKRAEGIVITEAIMDRAYAKAASLFKGNAKEVAKEVAKQNAAQTDATTAAAQAAKGATKGSETSKDILTRWIDMVKQGKLKEVTKEASKSEELMELYEKLASHVGRK